MIQRRTVGSVIERTVTAKVGLGIGCHNHVGFFVSSYSRRGKDAFYRAVSRNCFRVLWVHSTVFRFSWVRGRGEITPAQRQNHSIFSGTVKGGYIL